MGVHKNDNRFTSLSGAIDTAPLYGRKRPVKALKILGLLDEKMKESSSDTTLERPSPPPSPLSPLVSNYRSMDTCTPPLTGKAKKVLGSIDENMMKDRKMDADEMTEYHHSPPTSSSSPLSQKALKILGLLHDNDEDVKNGGRKHFLPTDPGDVDSLSSLSADAKKRGMNNGVMTERSPPLTSKALRLLGVLDEDLKGNGGVAMKKHPPPPPPPSPPPSPPPPPSPSSPPPSPSPSPPPGCIFIISYLGRHYF